MSSVVISEVAPGYALTSEGPLDASAFASDSADPVAVTRALDTLAATVPTYQRVWQADGGLDQVQNVLVRFPAPMEAQAFLTTARHALESGEIVSSGSLASVPGARLVTYFPAATASGVGEAITLRAGVYVALLSFFSAASGNSRPITPVVAERVALSQHAAMVAAPGGRPPPATTPARHGVTLGEVGAAALAVAVLAAAVATPLWLRRRREHQDHAATLQSGQA